MDIRTRNKSVKRGRMMLEGYIPRLRYLFPQRMPYLGPRFKSFICNLFRRGTSAFLIVFGRRETGKTDFALLMMEILEDAGIIKHFATNVKIYKSRFPIERVADLDALEEWASGTRGKKVYLFDEFGKAMRRRTPMAKLNVQLIDNFQILRKYQLSTVACTVSDKYVDNISLGDDILDGYFEKPYYKQKWKRQKIALYTDTLGGWTQTLRDIPPTSIDFDTWDVAPFKLHGEPTKPRFKTKEKNILWEWAHGKTYKDVGLHRMQINRLVRRFIRENLIVDK